MAKGIDLHEVAYQEDQSRSRLTCRVKVCSGTGCASAGAGAVHRALDTAILRHGLAHEIATVPTGCMGLCSRGPLVRVEPRGGTPVLYADVDAAGAATIGDVALRRHDVVEDLVLDESIPFFTEQHRVVLANAGRIDPARIEDYVLEGGYQALAAALRNPPEQVLGAVLQSGLRGRGGAGYPTGRKWELLAAAEDPEKYVVANGDEGDPGAFMDRTLMEDDPHRVIEGILLAAYATGATRAFIYVRAEYPGAVARLERAIRAAQRAGLLGRDILGSGFSLGVSVRIGAGAFVCGEETALMASIEGRRGQPRLRPPYPTEHGLWGHPTMINNVETLANIPGIVRDGPEAFAAVGTDTSKGTKVFALAGSLVNTGLIEVPMGISLRTIIEQMGGGVPGGRAFKAAQTGGPSGGCIPARHLDTPVDYEHLRALGSIMGSGGMIVMDETVRMPEVARYFMQFCREESCGKCTPCRAGTVQLHQILGRICDGEASRTDLSALEALSRTVRDLSLCGLGQSAPNPVFSTLHHFRDEYEALLAPAGGADG